MPIRANAFAAALSSPGDGDDLMQVRADCAGHEGGAPASGCQDGETPAELSLVMSNNPAVETDEEESPGDALMRWPVWNE